MVARALLRELEGSGVRLLVEDGRLVARGPAGAVTPELSARIRACRTDLMYEMTVGQKVTPLPEPLVRLVQAAIGDHLNRPLQMPVGQVPHMGSYVLACAALYACGIEQHRQVAQLWMVREAWNSTISN